MARRFVIVLAAGLLLGAAPALGAQAQRARARRVEPKSPAIEQMSSGRGTTRVELDGSEVNGQVNKAGAVLLMQRQELPIRSMVRQRSSFRDQIVRDVLAE